MNAPQTNVDYVERILRANVYDVAIESPLDAAPRLSRRLNRRVLLKREDLQPVFSFKIRGAYNKMSSLSAETRARGVIAASAGNHAQGVALAAQKLKCAATIVMPATTPDIKVNAVKSYGANTILHGDTYDDAYQHALLVAKDSGAVFVHPYDDVDVIAGQGTVALEILRQETGAIDAIFVPVGGGGLIAGVAAYAKRVRPSAKIIGVEPVDADAFARSLKAGERVRLEHVGAFADGVAVKQVGEEPFRVCRGLVDEVILVDTDDICAAIKDVFEDTRSILEPAGALAVAGLKKYAERAAANAGALIAIASGANMNFDRLRFVSERAEMGERREAVFAVTIPETPGSFKRLCRSIGARNITEFNYRYNDPAEAHVFVGIRVADRDEARGALDEFSSAGLRAIDLTDDEIAKLHVRYLVGGRNERVKHEMIYRFEFPERPGALMRFLEQMNPRWNISLFHYRNHGADFGRVLVGIQIPDGDRPEFERFLAQLGYEYQNETDNPACRLFLS
jgi:threonine dehydratase